jgi:phosphotransferase system enzyme I (PtsI)
VRKYGAEGNRALPYGIFIYESFGFAFRRRAVPSLQQVAEAVAPFGVTIRTLDMGGDKFISSVQIPKDMSPFLGMPGHPVLFGASGYF